MSEQLAFEMAEVGLDVPQGYKRTEVGVIPEDWEVKKIGDLCSLKSGLGITSQDISNSGKYSCYGGNGLRGYTSTYTHEGEYALIGRQGALCGNIQYVTGRFFASEHALVVTTQKQVATRWLAIGLDRMHLNQYSESSAQPGLSAEKLRVLNLATPPFEEQTAIATALSDVDALINELEQLIAKKQAIKTATMQQLLTGRTRLPQFALRDDGTPKGYKASELGEIPEDWDTFKLLEIANLIHGKAHEPVVSESGQYVLVNSKFISTEGNVRKHCYQNYCSAKQHDVLMVLSDLPNGKALAKCYYTDQDNTYAVNQRICIFRTKMVDAKYLFFILNRHEYFLGLDDGVTQTHILNGDIAACMLYAPSAKAEQTAIATTLTDMDSDIGNLQQRLSKTRQIKQGMMQQLLTGKIRLTPSPHPTTP